MGKWLYVFIFQLFLQISMKNMDIILKYFPTLSESQRSQLSALYPLYSEWNAKINVISRKDIENLYQNHVLHSLSIAKLIQFQAGSRVMSTPALAISTAHSP